eukprot:CAMPEP_0180253728 /NCGR_PEP_ID=MMETSP0987-20121128/39767_1 /TAXON_ID=697907 /ORGANISM="non described non described, Strain CCMP2293" /LENGTH=81 /DNA_ID=CAMNT_0022222639 /DNA_START=76 /DNA_END=318 /DNA_ORIENTATION=-
MATRMSCSRLTLFRVPFPGPGPVCAKPLPLCFRFECPLLLASRSARTSSTASCSRIAAGILNGFPSVRCPAFTSTGAFNTL